jgi:hypothetical protein
MSEGTLGVVSPGDRGHVVGSVIANKGYRVITFLEGRSDVTRRRAERSNMEDVGYITSPLQERNDAVSLICDDTPNHVAHITGAYDTKCSFRHNLYSILLFGRW